MIKSGKSLKQSVEPKPNDSTMTLVEETELVIAEKNKQINSNIGSEEISSETIQALKTRIRQLEEENDSLKESLKELRTVCGLVTEYM